MMKRKIAAKSVLYVLCSVFISLVLCGCSKNIFRADSGADTLCSSRLLSETVRDNFGGIPIKTRYIYNGKGQLAAVIHFPELFFEGLDGLWRYAYEHDRVREFIWVDSLGTKYAYDETGRLVSAYERSAGEYQAEYTISYDEDDQVSEVVIDSNYHPEDPRKFTYIHHEESTSVWSDHKEYEIEYKYGYSCPMVFVVRSSTEDNITVFTSLKGDVVLKCDTWIVNNKPVPVIYCSETDRISYNDNGLPVKAEDDYGWVEYRYRDIFWEKWLPR